MPYKDLESKKACERRWYARNKELKKLRRNRANVPIPAPKRSNPSPHMFQSLVPIPKTIAQLQAKIGVMGCSNPVPIPKRDVPIPVQANNGISKAYNEWGDLVVHYD